VKYLKSYKIFESSNLNDSYHRHGAILKSNGHVGMIHNWGFMKIYLFLDFETGEQVKLNNIGDVDLIDKEEFNRLREERNYEIPKEGETFTDRQKRYGKIHDTTLKAIMEGSPGGEYSSQFCREMAHIIASYMFHKEIFESYESIEQAREDKEKFMETFKKYFMSPECIYGKMCDEMGLHGESPKIGEAEILDYIEDSRKMEAEHNLIDPKDKIVKSFYKEGPSEELQFFIKMTE